MNVKVTYACSHPRALSQEGTDDDANAPQLRWGVTASAAAAVDSGHRVTPMYKYLLLIHVLGATIWTGGHLVLALTVLPKALKTRNVEAIRQFESGYERIGMPALFVQVITGIWLAYRVLPDPAAWFSFGSHTSTHILLKLVALTLTLILAMHARLRIIPRLDERRLTLLGYHIVSVTILAVIFVILGVSFRTGGLL